MKSIVLRLMLVLAAFAVVPDAVAADNGGTFFLNAKLGKMSDTSDWGDVGPSTQRHSSWGGGGGYLWNFDDGRSLGLELGYTHFGDISKSADANEFTTETTSANAMTAGALFQYSFGDGGAWDFEARLGLMRAKVDETLNFEMGGPPNTSSNSLHEGGLYGGIGVGREITQSFRLTLAYTEYYTTGNAIDLAVTWVGLEAEYRF